MTSKYNSSDKPMIQKRRLITEMTHLEAREFFLKQESYCNFTLPKYFIFEKLLNEIAKVITKNPQSNGARAHDDVNHLILNNKDGLYSWRPIELIHPVLYVALVNTITDEDCWKKIIKRFRLFALTSHIHCLSLPGESLTTRSDKTEQISQWWQDVEQQSLELALDYEFLIRTDVVDCYASMYTHSIAWALHTKPIAKRLRKPNRLVGNKVDTYLQDMHQGQTNGLPQGSALMDLIAELVLGYADRLLSKRLRNASVLDYQILRYRDDYRIFAHTKRDGETILKHLTEIMIELGLKLSPTKTHVSEDVIRSSIKDDKLAWLVRKQGDRSFQKQLLIIHDHSIEFPNSGSVDRALSQLHRRIDKRLKKAPGNVYQLISIVVDIAYRNPRTYPNCAAILSKLINLLDSPEHQTTVIMKILKKFGRIPNTGHLEIWLQRFSHKLDLDLDFDEPLCKEVRGEHDGIWNNEWIIAKRLRKVMKSATIVDQKVIDEMDATIDVDEVDPFPDVY